MRILRTDADRGIAMIRRDIGGNVTFLERCQYSEIQISELGTKRHIALTIILKWFRRRDPVQVLRDKGGI